MSDMEKLKLIMLTIGIFCTSLLFHSCLDDDGYSLGDFVMEVATVESTDSNQHYFKLDDGATLWPAAGYYLGHNLEDGQRAWLNYTILSDEKDGFTHYVKVNGVDPVLTKTIAEDLGEKNDSVYGTDPISVKNIWIGNGYLNVIFGFNYGGKERHFVNLLHKVDAEAENPYELEFRHNAYDDPPEASVPGIVCFDLSDLPDTEGETVKLKVNVKTFNGAKTYELEYNSGKDMMSERAPSNSGLDYFERVN